MKMNSIAGLYRFSMKTINVSDHSEIYGIHTIHWIGNDQQLIFNIIFITIKFYVYLDQMNRSKTRCTMYTVHRSNNVSKRYISDE